MIKKRLNAIYQSHKNEFSGTCLITRGAEILLSESNGFANLDFNVANAMNTRFDTASVTKVFTAVAVLQLVERGALRLDDKIHDILDLKGTAIPDDVLVKHLLNHTSGIADDADEEAGEDYSALFVDKPNYAIRNCADFLPQFAYKSSNFKAGTNVRYNNCAFILLGLVIERVVGMDYRSFVTAHVFKPAGMAHTYFGAKDEVCPNTAEGYFAVRDENGGFMKWKKNIYSCPPIGTADGGAFTTAGDLNMFICALKNGTLLSPGYTDMLFTPQCAFTRQHDFGMWRTGYGFEFIESDGTVLCMYKEGVNSGVAAMCAYYPELDICLNMLSNRDGSFWTICGELQAVLLEERLKSK
ncbi:MAG: beta-lactamase family protein [Oscillospiraceae bacterium]|nr:beta-lactamase family protein [Oscillospiraceae bacterium]